MLLIGPHFGVVGERSEIASIARYIGPVKSSVMKSIEFPVVCLMNGSDKSVVSVVVVVLVMKNQ